MSKNNTFKKISIIIPTFNEAGTIRKVIREIKQLKNLYRLEIIVIDGNSKDDTVKIVENEKVLLIKRKKKYGKGADFWYAAKKVTGDYVVQIDADYQFVPSEIPLLIKGLDGGADVALAWRVNHKDAPFIRTLGNYIFSPITSILLCKRIHDVVAGFKAFKTPALLSLNLKEKHFGYEGEVVVKAVRMGYKIAQVPVTYKPRLTGKSQVNFVRDGFLTLWSIFKARFSHL